MSKTYSRNEIQAEVREELEKNPATLHKSNVVNRKGTTSDGVRYTEIAAEEILKNINKLYSIPVITRSASYKIEGHAELAKRERPENSNRDEEWIAIDMYGKELDHIGTIVDFQVPLKTPKGGEKNDGVGKIDLLSYSQWWTLGEHVEYKSKAHLLELKKPESTETLLRCVLEAFTYWKTVNAPKLLSDFNMLPTTTLIPTVLIFNNGLAFKDFNEDSLHNIMVKGLMWELGVELYSISDVPARAFNNICSISYFAKNWGEGLGLCADISDPKLKMTFHAYYNIELFANMLMSELIKNETEPEKVSDWYGHLDTIQFAYNIIDRITPNDSEEQICAVIQEEITDPSMSYAMRNYAEEIICLQKTLGLRKD